MSHRWIRMLACALVSLAAVLVARAAGEPLAATVRHARIEHPGRYVVTIALASAARRDAVEVRVGDLPPRRVMLAEHRVSRYSIVAVLSAPLTVRAVGHPARPRLMIATRPVAAPPARASQASGPAVSSMGADGTPAGDDGNGGPVSTTASGGPPYETLVWSADFDGPAGSPPNPAQWSFDLGAWGDDGELETYTDNPANAALDGQGDLVITALRQAATGPDGVTKPYTSARLETAGLFSFTYGRIEASMRVPLGAGLWPAFWMLGDDIGTAGWPQSGEIDVMEMLGQDPTTVYGTIHGPVARSTSVYQLQGRAVSPQSLADAFHTYGVIWQPGKITWTLDGVPYATASRGDLARGEEWVFDTNPFHLVLNLAVGGDWPGPPDGSTPFPARLLIRSVRVYQ